MQPDSLLPGAWNRVEYRPLEGFVIAITPFNFLCLANARLRAGDDGQRRPVEAGRAGRALGLVRAQAARGGGAAARRDQPRVRRRARDRPGRAHRPRPRRRQLHRLGRGVPGDLAHDRREHRPLPQLPPHRRRDRRQGLHRRPRERRPRCAGDLDRARRVRVPGPEVLGARRGCTCPRACGRRCATGSRPRCRSCASATRPIRASSSAPSSTTPPCERHRAAIAESRSAQTARSSSAARSTTRRAGSCTPTVVRTRDPGFRLLRDELFGPIMTAFVYPDSRWTRAARAGRPPEPLRPHRRRLRRRPPRRRRGPRRPAPRRRQLLRQRQADRLGGRRCSRSAARAHRARTTRPRRSGTSAAG